MYLLNVVDKKGNGMVSVFWTDFLTENLCRFGISPVVYNSENVMTNFHQVICLPRLLRLAPLRDEFGHLVITA